MLCFGVLARGKGHDEESRARLEESLTISRDIGARWLTGMALASRGWFAWFGGDKGGARAQARDALTLLHDTGLLGGIASCLFLSGILAVEDGEVRRGARLLARADADRVDHVLRLMHIPQDRDACIQSIAAARTILGEPEFGATWAEGQAMTLEQAIALALEEGGRL